MFKKFVAPATAFGLLAYQMRSKSVMAAPKGVKLFDLTVKDIDGNSVVLRDLMNEKKVCLVVNTAMK